MSKRGLRLWPTFIHHKGEVTTSIPLLLIHGCSGSFVRFLKTIPPLTKADNNGPSFVIVVPSVSGHGFSDRPIEPGMNPKKIAGLFADVMKALGYDKFVAQVGDFTA